MAIAVAVGGGGCCLRAAPAGAGGRSLLEGLTQQDARERGPLRVLAQIHALEVDRLTTRLRAHPLV